MKSQKRKKETDTGFSGTGEAYDMGVNKDGVRARPSDFISFVNYNSVWNSLKGLGR